MIPTASFVGELIPMNNPSLGPKRRKRAVILILLGLVVVTFTFTLVDLGRDILTERQVLAALQSTNRIGEVTAEGVEILRQVDQRAIPVLLRLSEGRDPGWYKWINPVRKFLKKPPLGGTSWPRKEMARRGFGILRERAAPAVPRLLGRLSDSDRDVRRISVHMLGAIGPSIGAQAFQQMTNCLSDPDQEVRNDVVWAVQFHRPEEYPAETLLSVYLRGLQDAYPVARQNAMIGLTRMGKAAAPGRREIEKALNDTDSGVQSMAQRLLDQFEME